MADHPRLQALRARHADLEAQLREEQRRPYPDHLRLTQLKMKKLSVKEAMREVHS